ncbi:MAG: hypothetical protein Q8R24_01735 [Legionellaceae bacterium]|nr:hypothetical protein [Legionellaceae bacterium]
MDFLITDDELEALCGLSHIQQLAYLRGIRPYMDVKTGLVGIKRGISYQSIAEQLYVEPHQGIKNESFSRSQVRRALSGLERTGLIQSQSQTLKLILKCNLASRPYSVQNKPVTKPSHQAVMEPLSQLDEINENLSHEPEKADIGKIAKADTPLKDNNYIYFLSQFEKFWSRYPEKKSRQIAWDAFQQLNLDDTLFSKIMQAIDSQIKHREELQVHGVWLPPWKYPANWLKQQCWEDVLDMDKKQETKRATIKKNTRNEPAKDMFWVPSEAADDEELTHNNVIQFQRR